MKRGIVFKRARTPSVWSWTMGVRVAKKWETGFKIALGFATRGTFFAGIAQKTESHEGSLYERGQKKPRQEECF